MKDKFGKTIESRDIVLLADESDLIFAVVQNVSQDMVNAAAGGINYMYATNHVIKVEELPVNTREILRGEDKNFDWLTINSPIPYGNSASYFDYTCHYLQHRLPHLSIEVCTLLLIDLHTTDEEFYELLFRKFCENEAQITGTVPETDFTIN